MKQFTVVIALISSLYMVVGCNAASTKILQKSNNQNDHTSAREHSLAETQEAEAPTFFSPSLAGPQVAPAATSANDAQIDLQPTTSQAKEEIETTTLVAKFEQRTHNFTKSETEHIKFASYNPFTAGKLTIDLDDKDIKSCYPYDGKLISPYGMRGRRMHTGSDIKGVRGERIYSVFDGTVRIARPYGGYGNVVVIRHDNGLETIYSHNLKNLVRVGDRVLAGDAVALIGRTGSASTEHLHFELRVQGKVLNPSLLLDLPNRRIQTGCLIISSSSSGSISGRRVGGSSSSTDEESKSLVSSAPTVKSLNPEPTKSTTSTAEKKYHTINSGDTLYALALKYKTSVRSICALNNINDTTILALGRKLRIK